MIDVCEVCGIHKLSRKCDELENQLSLARNRIDELSATNASLRRDDSDRSVRLDQEQHRANMLQDDLNMVERLRDGLAEKLKSAECACDNQRQAAKDTIDTLGIRLANEYGKLIAARQQRDNFGMDNERLVRENAELAKDIATLKSECCDIRQGVSSNEKRTIDNLRGHNRDLLNEIEDLRDGGEAHWFDRFTAKCKELVNAESRWVSSCDEYKTAKRHLAQADDMNIVLAGKCDAAEAVAKSATAERDLSNSCLTTVKELCRTVRDERDVAKRATETDRIEMDSLNRVNLGLVGEVEGLKKQSPVGWIDQWPDLKDTIKRLEEELDISQSNYKMASDERSEVWTKVRRLRLELAKAKEREFTEGEMDVVHSHLDSIIKRQGYIYTGYDKAVVVAYAHSIAKALNIDLEGSE